MTNQRATTFAERSRFVQLRESGLSYAQIAAGSGWKPETVKKHCLAHRHQGIIALRPKQPGRKRRGPLSTFDPIVRWAALRVKRQHPAWGPDVVIDELRQRPSTYRCRLPCASQLAAYYQQFGSRLIKPKRRLQLPPPIEPSSADDGIVFQLDMQERLYLPQLGYFNVLNIRAPDWGLFVGSYPHPAGEKRWNRKVSQQEAREDCRQTFTVWGLPDVIQTDRDKVLVTTGEYPFPSNFTLWLVGLGITHRLIQRVIQNGCVERTHRTFDKQMLSGVDVANWSDFMTHVQAECRRLNERLPSRAKACRGQIPIQAHPEALTPKRPYQPEQETHLFDMQRVYCYLAGGRWLRHTSSKGQFKLANRVWTVGRKNRSQPVVITFDLSTKQFVVQTVMGEELKRLPSDWLTEAAIRDLPDDSVVNVRIPDT
jgi:hypothetical protein